MFQRKIALASIAILRHLDALCLAYVVTGIYYRNQLSKYWYLLACCRSLLLRVRSMLERKRTLCNVWCIFGAASYVVAGYLTSAIVLHSSMAVHRPLAEAIVLRTARRRACLLALHRFRLAAQKSSARASMQVVFVALYYYYLLFRP